MDAADPLPVDWPSLAAKHPALRLLVLIGSRATGTAHERSDWDFAYLEDEPPDGPRLDVGTLVSDLTQALGTDAVDLADLARASAVLRRDAAVDGRLLGERRAGAFGDFQIEAMRFWYDAEHVLREAFEDVRRAMAG